MAITIGLLNLYNLCSVVDGTFSLRMWIQSINNISNFCSPSIIQVSKEITFFLFRFANIGNLERAIEDFDKALKINSLHPNARKYMGETLVAEGRM